MSTDVRRATLSDLMKVEGKAELIDGRIVEMSPVGGIPNFTAGEIFASLREYARSAGRGRAGTDSLGYAVPELSSGRQSFSPDASGVVALRGGHSASGWLHSGWRRIDPSTSRISTDVQEDRR